MTCLPGGRSTIETTSLTGILGHYFDTNGFGTEGDDAAKLKDILMRVCGGRIYKLMSDLPEKPGTKTFEV